MQVKNSGGSVLRHGWLNHMAETQTIDTLRFTGLLDAHATVEVPFFYFSGVHDYWTLTVIDEDGNVWGSDVRIRAPMPDATVARVMVTVEQDRTRMTIDIPGQSSQSYPLYKLP